MFKGMQPEKNILSDDELCDYYSPDKHIAYGDISSFLTKTLEYEHARNNAHILPCLTAFHDLMRYYLQTYDSFTVTTLGVRFPGEKLFSDNNINSTNQDLCRTLCEEVSETSATFYPNLESPIPDNTKFLVIQRTIHSAKMIPGAKWYFIMFTPRSLTGVDIVDVKKNIGQIWASILLEFLSAKSQIPADYRSTFTARYRWNLVSTSTIGCCAMFSSSTAVSAVFPIGSLHRLISALVSGKKRPDMKRVLIPIYVSNF